MNTYKEWAAFLKSPGSISLMPHSALREPCPKCGGHKGYSVTSDGYAYCEACSWGTGTDFPFTNRPLEILNPDGSINHEKTDRIYE